MDTSRYRTLRLLSCRDPFHVRTISVAESEAAHVVDGLLHHGATIDSAVHHTDGGGVSDHVFGLLTLLGFCFAPRIPNLRDRRLYAFGPASTWPTIEPFINWLSRSRSCRSSALTAHSPPHIPDAPLAGSVMPSLADLDSSPVS